MRSLEFLDPDLRDKEYDDSTVGPLDEDDDEEDEGLVTHEEETDPGVEADGEDDNEIENDSPGAGPTDEGTEVIDNEAEALAADEIEARTPRWARLGDLLLDYKHWRNPRSFTGLDPDSIRLLADDIKRNSKNTEEGLLAGINDPLLVVRIQGPKSEIHELVLDGQRRHKAATMAELGDDALIPVRDREPVPVKWSQDLARLYLREVLRVVGLREGLSAFELSESAAELRATNDPDTGNITTMAAIAATIGRSESWVSKILTARKAASAKLLERWRKGEISEEQFRDLAVSAKGAEQEKQADAVAEARASGDKSGARQSAKERREVARLEAQVKRDKAKADKDAAKAQRKADKEAKRAAKKQGKGKKGPVVAGPQADLPLASGPDKSAPAAASGPDKPAPAAAPTKPKPMQAVIIEDLLVMTAKKPPTHDLVKGVVLGIMVASGRMDMETLPKQWHQYIHHATGTTPAKPPKKGKRK